ncbi:hypothetical protein AB0G04_42670 [Actinoplanes sp. NPDC023801]|uniref:hypothetical protein n=1 Tax=Actinoplanes sp. NPDC023801 TaxID=3154595 RepID=UPI0033CBF2C5
MRALWAIPVAVLLTVVLMPVNDGFYETWINYDAQGDSQQWEWRYHREVMRNTSGYLCGHVLALLTGVWLAQRHRYPVALAAAAGVASAMAAAVFVAARAIGGERVRVTTDGRVLWEPGAIGDLPYGPLLAAFPLYALAGVGLGVLFGGRIRSRAARIVAVVVLAGGWMVATMAGLLQDDRLGLPMWTLVVVPPLAAATVIGMASLSLDAWDLYPSLTGDWGDAAADALVLGLTAWTAVLAVAARARAAAAGPSSRR